MLLSLSQPFHQVIQSNLGNPKISSTSSFSGRQQQLPHNTTSHKTYSALRSPSRVWLTITSSALPSSLSPQKKKKKKFPGKICLRASKRRQQVKSHRLLIGRVPALLYWISCLVALSDNVVVTLTAQVKSETDDKRRHSKQSHVVPFGLAGPGNSTSALPMAPRPSHTHTHTHNTTSVQHRLLLPC